MVVVPTSKPIQRLDQADLIYRSERGKFKACVGEIKERHAKGQLILVGTTSVEKLSEIIHRMLKAEGIEHEVLNAKLHSPRSCDRRAGWSSECGDGCDQHGRSRNRYHPRWQRRILGAMPPRRNGDLPSATHEWEFVEDFVKQICIGNEDNARALRASEEVLASIPDSVIEQIAEKRDLFGESRQRFSTQAACSFWGQNDTKAGVSIISSEAGPDVKAILVQAVSTFRLKTISCVSLRATGWHQ